MAIIDTSKLRESPTPELAAYLIKLRNESLEEDITNFILSAVRGESIPPTIFGVWLSIASTPKTFKQAIDQDFSVYTRRAAIKRLFNPRKPRWHTFSTEEILSLLSKMSVTEIKLCLNQLGKHKGKEEKITELLEGLMPLVYPASAYRTSDERPLGDIYASLHPACLPKIIDQTFRGDSTFAKILKPRFMQRQYKLLRKHCLDIIFKGKKSSLNLEIILPHLQHNIPALPSSKPGYSEPMLFSLTLLERLAADPEIKIPGFPVLPSIIDPLLRKIKKKRLDWNQTKEVVDLAMVYLSSHEEEISYLQLTDRNQLLYFCVKLWASSGMQFECEPRLIFFLKLMSGKTNNIRAYITTLNWAPKIRYRFLKLLFQYTWSKSIDIELTESLKQVNSKWPCDLFSSLEVEQAVGLLRRIRSINGDDFLEPESPYSNSILAVSSSPELSNTDPLILFAILQPENPEVWERGKATVEERKKKAATSRAETERAFYAKSALFYAISTGSLEIYGETVTWAKRFIRDPFTSKTIFAKSVCNTNEGIILLSGLPRTHLATFTISDIAERILEANKIIFNIFEIILLAMKEPSFHLPHWSGPLELLGDVVRSRMAHSKVLQKTLNISDDQLYETIWKSTLELTIRIEKIGLQPDYELLQLKKPAGVLGSHRIEMEECPRACFRFVDNLAKARDDLWHEFRPSLYPTVTTLPPTLPRGLPIQFLVPQFVLNIKAAKGFIPFISSRADAIVLAKSEALDGLPDNDEIQQAIGPFVDSYTFALQIYAEQSLIPWEDHVTKAWKHALGSLSKRMSPDEAHRTWKIIFDRALPDFKIGSMDPMTSMEYPLFPFDAEVGLYTEWNPVEAFKPPPAVKSRSLKPLTYLDCTLCTFASSHFVADSKFLAKELETQSFQPPDCNMFALWRLSNNELRNPAVREGLVVSALLLLEQDIPHWKGSLAKPFPSQDVRYPDLWLDLSDLNKMGASQALSVLNRLRSTVPPTLLYRVTDAAMNALDAAEGNPAMARLEHLAYGLLSLLAASDRPLIATDLILKVIIERPESSSWHRKLLSIGFLNSLSSVQAKDLIQSFLSKIQEKMKNPKSHVKITTIKYFAQLLNGTSFVEPSFAVDILTQLFKTSKHIDIRVSVVESLIEMLRGCEETSLADRIFEALKSVIPTAGSLNERQETDWAKADRTGDLPSIYDQDRPSPDLFLPPILEKIITTNVGSWEKRYSTEVVMPVFELSIENNRRWLKMFVAKHELELPTLRLPQLPVKPKFLKVLIQRFKSNPTHQLLGLYQSFVLTNMSPSPKLATFNTKLQDPAFRDDLGAKHWLSLYGKGVSVYLYDGFCLHDNLRHEDTSSATVQIVQAMLGEQARLLLRLNDLQTFNLFMERFSSGQTMIVSGDKFKNSRLAIERIILFIDSLRTPKWHENLNRQPVALPRTLKYKLWLLPYPPTDATEEDLAKFAQAIHESVQDISWPGNAYHEEFNLIKSALVRIEVNHRAQVACMLGKLEWELDLVDVLCVELAKTLFETASVPKDPIIVTSRRVLNQWRECVVESVRTKERELRFGAFLNKKWEALLLEK